MEFLWYDLALLYMLYSFLGWIGETLVSIARGRGFVKRGFAAGPFCYVYGFAAVIMTIGFADLRSSLLFLFVGCALTSTMVEWTAAKILERLHHRTWWDYSHHRFNIDGYVCLPYSLLWGVLGCIALLWGNQLLLSLFHLLPVWLMKTLAWVLGVLAVLDQLGSVAILAHHPTRLEGLNRELESRSRNLYDRISQWMEHRIEGAYPHVAEKAARAETGMSLSDVVWLFTVGSLVGDIVETIFCRATAGVWMSRSSVVWGPFSLVWGLALALATLLLYRYKDKPASFLFVAGTVLGGAYEYLCSVFTELVFGTVFWDYSKIPFNLGGRINLLYCFFWGFAAVAWFRLVYPHFSRWIEAIPITPGRILTAALVVFMAANICVSALAMGRYSQRAQGLPATASWQVWMDEHYPDEAMKRIYPNAKRTD